MKIDSIVGVELGEIIKDEKEYINTMIKELNIPIDSSLSKNKIYEKYKGTIIQKFKKPSKYPCIVVNYKNDQNEIITEFLYPSDLKEDIKEYKNKIKKLEQALNKMIPQKKKEDFSFL